jgi:hypothetical protein
MKVHFRFLRGAREFQAELRNDGWKLEADRDEFFLGRHPEVSDEGAARNRLHRLGILTSRSLCIEFRHIPEAEGRDNRQVRLIDGQK